jgi:DNA invertase Pin-like site-specific DNA recombinase
MTVGIYIRVSTQEQAKEGYSIQAQKERLLSFCDAQGWKDFKIYPDEGVSAKDTNRPYLQQLLNDVKAGKISTILVYRLDRFTRRVKDLHKMLEFLEQHKCAFRSATEPYDTSTAMGKLFITIVAALAEWETDNLSERVKMALEEKVANEGEHVGGVPFGFDITDEEKLIPNEKASTVLTMIEKTKEGMSAHQLAKYLNKVNTDRIWYPQGVLRVLQNPALYGAARWNDKVYENQHTGLISKDEFLKLQQLLEDRSQHRRREVDSIYLFQGVLACHQCGNILSVNRYVRKKKDGTEYQGAVYKCQVCYKEGRKMLQIGEHRFVDALKIFMKNFKFENVKMPVSGAEDNEREILSKQLSKIERQREKYQRAWANDKMTDDEFDKLMDETRELYDELKLKIVQIKAPIKIDIEALKQIVFTFNESFSLLTHEEKKMFVAQFIRKIEFKLHSKPPVKSKYKKGKEDIEITDILFY